MSDPHHWIGVVHRKQAAAARAAGLCAFSHGKEAPVKKLTAGDGLIFYAPKTDFDGEAVNAFVELAEVTGTTHRQQVFPGTDFTAWVRDASYSDTNEVPIRPMLEDLSFITNPRYWGMAFRRGLFEIPKVDFDLIQKAMLA